RDGSSSPTRRAESLSWRSLSLKRSCHGSNGQTPGSWLRRNGVDRSRSSADAGPSPCRRARHYVTNSYLWAEVRSRMTRAAPHRVAVTDFLEETSVEESVLGDLARLDTLRASSESELRGRIADAHILLVYHDISRLGHAALAEAHSCVGI